MEQIPQKLKKILPYGVKVTLRKIADNVERIRFRKRLSRLTFKLPKDKIVLNYGGMTPKERGEVANGGRIKLIHLDSMFPEYHSNFNILYLVSSALPRFAFDLVLWAKKKGVKLVWNQDGVAYPAWAGDNHTVINRPMKMLIHLADFVFYQSNFCKESADIYLGPVSCPWEVACNCVDTEHFAPYAGPSSFKTWKLLAAGTHHHSYRVFSVLETAAELKRRGHPVQLTIAGEMTWPDAKREVKQEIERLELLKVVQSHPAFTQQEASGIYQSAHVLLHPKYKDPCPTVVIEAMSCGVPVVGSKSGGMPELVGERGGRLLDVPQSWEQNHAPDPVLMADSVEEIMKDRHKFSENAHAWVKDKFGKDQWLDQHRRVFKNLLFREG